MKIFLIFSICQCQLKLRLNKLSDPFLDKITTGQLEQWVKNDQGRRTSGRWVPICWKDFTLSAAQSVCKRLANQKLGFFGQMQNLRNGNLGHHLLFKRPESFQCLTRRRYFQGEGNEFKSLVENWKWITFCNRMRMPKWQYCSPSLRTEHWLRNKISISSNWPMSRVSCWMLFR